MNAFFAILADEDTIAAYHNLVTEQQGFVDEMRTYIMSAKHCVPFLNPGRLVEAFTDSSKSAVWGWGVLLSFKKAEKGWGEAKAAKSDAEVYMCDVLLPCAPSKSVTTATGQEIAVGEGTFQPPREGEKIEFQVVQVPHGIIKELSSVRIHIPQVWNPSSRWLLLGSGVRVRLGG